MERTTQTMPWLLRRPFRIVSSVTTTLTPSSSITPIKGTRARSLAGMRTRARCFILDDTLRISGRRRLGWQQAHCISAIALVSCRWLFIGIPKALLCAVDRVSQAHYSNSAGTFFPYVGVHGYCRLAGGTIGVSTIYRKCTSVHLVDRNFVTSRLSWRRLTTCTWHRTACLTLRH